eukprot:TRINITY_DN59404_c1_g2_i1.p3 TRINITY_DN59404_c1_g2~~TRINITY_DN59404_c1_g2_i1.p3  ORF type:complete len:139 (+),score=14.14 TRINITY_DN59404_c1_g2_i1:1367-1783(+)
MWYCGMGWQRPNPQRTSSRKAAPLLFHGTAEQYGSMGPNTKKKGHAPYLHISEAPAQVTRLIPGELPSSKLVNRNPACHHYYCCCVSWLLWYGLTVVWAPPPLEVHCPHCLDAFATPWTILQCHHQAQQQNPMGVCLV